MGENGLRLSGGNASAWPSRRRTLKDAPVVILDEATAHVDPLTEAKIWEALESFMQGRTCLIITHGRAGLEHVDQIVRLGEA